MHTPYFPPWRARLAALGRRLQQPRSQNFFRLQPLFGSLIPPGLLAQAEEGPNSRERTFSLARTFWLFLSQVLNPGTACREVVRQLRALFLLHNLGPVDEGTAAYCLARKRLPMDTLVRLRQSAAAHAQKLLPLAQQLWYGLRPVLADGTGLSLADTAENQRAYPQSRSQKPGCGFPLLKIVGLFSLSSGALLDYAKGNKHRHELSLLCKLLEQFKPGDLLVADRGFCSYALIALLLVRGVGSLFRLHQRRPIDWRQGRRLGKEDRLIRWRKPLLKPRYLPNTLWKRIPQELSVRVLRFRLVVPGYRPESVTLVTTLVDAKAYPARDLARLYARRWQIELFFDDLKTTLGMDQLRCKTPQMVHKELEMFFIAYNFLRVWMTEAAALYQVPVERVSFKGTLDSVRQYSITIAQARSKKKQRQLVADLLAVMAADLVPERPGRVEPRARKRRPKPYPLLNKPRQQFKDIAHRNRYWKNNPRKTKA